MKYEMHTSSLTGDWPNDAIYSEPITKSIVFTNKTELKTFRDMVDEIIVDEVNNTMFNNVDPFLK